MKLVIDGLHMEYEDRGRGTPVLLIHGYPLNRTLWDPQMKGLADTARLLAPDLRGHGESNATPAPYSMDMLADDCRALLDAAGVNTPAVLCGLSMGGYVALAFCRKYPERVAGLVLAATKMGADSAEGKAGRDKSAALAREKGAAAIAEAMLPKMLAPQTAANRPQLVDRARKMMESTSVEGIVGALMAMKERPDSTPTVKALDLPLLVIHGMEDQLIPVSEAEATRAAAPDARLERLPEAGHLLNLEQPERFNAALREFLRQF